MSTQHRTTHKVPGWNLPFTIALILHVIVVASALVLPKYLQKKPILPDFQTVDLINIAEPVAPPAPPQPSTPVAQTKVSQTKSTLEPQQTKVVKVNKPVISTAPEPVDVTSPTPVKAVSIKPLKRKIKKKLPPDTRERDKRRAKEAEQKRKQLARKLKKQQLLQEARHKKAIADAEEAAANDAIKALKQMLQADDAATSEKETQQRIQSTAMRAGSSSSSVLETQYQSSIFSRLQQFWALPEIKPWDPDLTAVVVIQIDKSGRILSHSFEKHSGDRVFDQFVSRTIQDANPLPAIPAALKTLQYTIGLRFKPGKIQ